ncbi:MAG: NAD-dependent epimerase/dehydratase family protein [Deltaproteobacteria bacterium]|nr:MAG: NAD-dependent epimerase/dehydratase family protein [Deltaproteobacteria bacterium]
MADVHGQRALVTGANGHVGVNLVRAARDAGYAVVALVRPTSDLRGLDGVDVEVRRGDILDPASLRAAAEGCDVLFHAAAAHKTWSRDPAREILAPAVEGTRNAVEAAAAAGVRRVVYTSSSNTIGFSRGPTPLSEADHADPAAYRVPYVKAKIAAERAAFETAARLGVDLVALNPTGIMGPGDHRITPTTAHAVGLFNGAAPVFAAGGVNLVDARDVARAHVLAAERGRPGERYLVGGDNLTWSEVADHVAALTGRRPKVLRLGRRPLTAIGAVLELAARVTGKPPALSRAVIADGLDRFIWFDSGKARRELGFEPADGGAVLRATLRWLLGTGHIKEQVARRLSAELTPLSL